MGSGVGSGNDERVCCSHWPPRPQVTMWNLVFYAEGALLCFLEFFSQHPPCLIYVSVTTCSYYMYIVWVLCLLSHSGFEGMVFVNGKLQKIPAPCGKYAT